MIKSTIKAYLAVIAIGLILFMACADDEPLEVGKTTEEGGFENKSSPIP